MTLDFESAENTCVITQYDLIKKLCKNSPNELMGPHRGTPAPKDLFKIKLNSEIVSKTKSDECHETTAKSLWASQIGRPDMQLLNRFHYTRVKRPDSQDFGKLRLMMGYL